MHLLCGTPVHADNRQAESGVTTQVVRASDDAHAKSMSGPRTSWSQATRSESVAWCR